MKNYFAILLLAYVLALAGCSGSDVYQGNWKATDIDGNKLEIEFEPKSFTVKEMNGKVKKFDYTQNSIKIKNSVKTYGIQLSDGRVFNILFPIATDTNKMVITIGNNEPLYTLSRKTYIQYKDLYKLTE